MHKMAQRCQVVHNFLYTHFAIYNFSILPIDGVICHWPLYDLQMDMHEHSKKSSGFVEEENRLLTIKGVLHLLHQKLTCSVLYLKLSTSFWKIILVSYSKLSKELKNNIKIKVGQAVLELLIQTTL